MNGFASVVRTIWCVCVLSACATGAGFCQKAAATDAVDVLVIDAGHGGHDAGAVSVRGKAKEKDVNLSVALKFGKAVKEKYPDVKVVYTRTTDVFLELWQRGQVANDHHADLFVSIHCNSTGGSVEARRNARGTETWVRGTETDAQNLAQVQRENEVIRLEKNYEEKYSQSWMDQIAATVHQGINFENSVDFAAILQDVYRTRIPNWPDRSVKQGKLYVLWKSARPSVLTEIGFLCNEEGETFLASDEGQDKIVECLMEAFGRYKEKVDHRSGIVAPAPTEPAPAPTPNPTEPAPAPSEPAPAAPSAPAQTAQTAPVAATPIAPVVSTPVAEAALQDGAPTDTPPAAASPEQSVQEGFIPSPSQVLAGDKPDTVVVPVASAQAQDQVPAPAHAPEPAPESKIVFKVQIMSSQKDVKLLSENFKGLAGNLLSRWYDAERRLYKYCYGSSASYTELQRFLEAAKKAGFAEAFPVAFEDGKSIPLSVARKKTGQ